MACAAPSWLEEVRRRERGFEQLEAKITELWGYLNAATSRFLALVAEFDRAKGVRAPRPRQHGAVAELAVRHRRRCGAREGARRASARAVARDRRRVRERRDLVLEGPRDDARRDGRERIRARARRAPRHGGARREARAEVSLDAAARRREARAAAARAAQRLLLLRRGRYSSS